MMQHADTVATVLDPGMLAERFEQTYRDALGDPARIPWEDSRPNPAIVTWLNHVAPSIVRCGARVGVVGCGLGFDAVELAHRGYDVTAFDWSAEAIDWARSRVPERASIFTQADLFDPPPRWRHRFDLVVEIDTVQSLPPDLRDQAFASVADLLAPHGHALVICRATEVSVVGVKDDPPWSLTRDELVNHTERAGLAPVGEIDVFEEDDDDQTPAQLRMRGLFARSR